MLSFHSSSFPLDWVMRSRARDIIISLWGRIIGYKATDGLVISVLSLVSTSQYHVLLCSSDTDHDSFVREVACIFVPTSSLQDILALLALYVCTTVYSLPWYKQTLHHGQDCVPFLPLHFNRQVLSSHCFYILVLYCTESTILDHIFIFTPLQHIDIV